MKPYLLLLLFSGLALNAVRVAAGDDHTRARELVEAGEIIPLEQLLEKQLSGKQLRILEVELESEDGTLVYEIEILDEKGTVRELLFDARTGTPLGEED